MTTGVGVPTSERTLTLSVLGDLEICVDGEAVTLGGPKQRSVLAALIVAGGRRVSTERLIEAVYGDDAPSGARRSVQTYVSNLRGLLAGAVGSERDGYALDLTGAVIDASLFEDEVAAGMDELDDAAESAAETLRAALARWRGHPFADVDGGTLVTTEIRRLEELRLTALEARIEADLALGRHEQIVPELEALTEEHPYREHLRRHHMIALYRSGRQSEALRSYERTRRVLLDELGIDPSPELRDLELKILDHDPSLRLAGGGPAVTRCAVLVIGVDVEDASETVGPDDLARSLVSIDALVVSAAEKNGGEVFAQRLNATFARFRDVASAVAAAESMIGSSAAFVGDTAVVSIGVDVGDVETAEDRSVAGPVVIRASGLMSMAHPGQVVMSAAGQREAAGIDGLTFRGLGQHVIPQLGREEQLFQLVVDGGPASFPPLRDGMGAPVPGSIRIMPGYELRREVARGPGWVVWRGYQPSVGREVAIQVVDATLASRPAYVRRFEIDALTVARLEHPNVVPLYDYLRDQTGAYLVTRWIGGTTLARAAKGSSLDLAGLTRLIDGPGGALAAAHAVGVTHGDVSAKVLLVGPGGELFLTGFGLAPSTESDTRGVTGDLAAFVEVMRQTAGSDAQPSVEALVAGGSPATMAELRARWSRVAGSIPGATAGEPSPVRNPYHGLDAFSHVDARDFHGRDEAIARILARVSAGRLTAVVGPSGVGKSSVVRAGVLPAILDDALPGSSGWYVTSMTPGSDPFGAFVSAMLQIATVTLPDLDRQALDVPHGLTRVASRVLPRGGRILLLIDQFEELFTLTPDEDERRRFLDSLAALVIDPGADVRVIVTIRADFFDQPLRHGEFGDLLRSATVPLSAPTREELVDLISRPAESVGVSFEAGLVERLIGDVGRQPGRLPLLEYVLTELFDGRTSDVIDAASYDAMGGVLGALGRRADAVYERLDSAGQARARQVFLRLVTLADEARPVRRRVRRAQLERLEGEGGRTEGVIDAFVTERLLTLDRDPVTRGPTVEVAHEALFSEWKRLDGWIAEHVDHFVAGRRVEDAAVEWVRSGRDPDLLLAGGRLAQAEEWAADTDLTTTDSERLFLEESLAARDRAIARRRTRRRRLFVGISVAAVVGLLLAAVATVQWRSAERASTLATARELALRSGDNLDIDSERSVLLALESIRLSRRAGEELPESVTALHNALARHRTVERYAGGEFVDVSSDGALIATSDGSGGVAVIGRGSGVGTDVLARSDAVASGVRFSPDATKLAVVYEGAATGTALWLWDVATGTHTEMMIERQTEPFAPWPIQFSDDGRLMAMILGPGERSGVWDVSTGGQVLDLADSLDPVFLPASHSIVTFDMAAELFRVIDADSGATEHSFAVDNPMELYAPSPAGDRLAMASEDGSSVAVVEIATGREVWYEHWARPAALAWMGESRFVVGADGGVATVFSAEDGEVLARLAGHTGAVWAVATVPGTDEVVTAGLADGTTRVWSAESGDLAEVARVDSGVPDARWVEYASSSESISISRTGGPGEFWIAEAATLEETYRVEDPIVLLGHETRLVGDRSVAAVVTGAGSSLVSVTTGDVVYTPPPGRYVRRVTADLRHVLIGTDEGAGETSHTQIVDLEDGSTVTLDLDSRIANLSQDGALIWDARQPDGNTPLFDTSTGEALATLEALALQVMPDGEHVSLVTDDGDQVFAVLDELLAEEGTAHVSWDGRRLLSRVEGEPMESAEVVPHLWSGHASDGLIRPVAHTGSPDGSWVVTAGRDEPVRVWAADDGRLVTEILVPNETANTKTDFVLEDPDHLTVLVDDGILLTYTLDTDELIELAESRLTRTLTDDECREFLHLDGGCATV